MSQYSKLICFFIIGILFVILLQNKSLTSNKENSSAYMYYVLAQEWPASVCLSETCTTAYMQNNDGTHFNVHGLWPNGLGSDACTNPATCSSVTYDESLLDSTLLTWMKKWYAGLYSDAADFHAHEFEKHGTCWNTTTTVLKQWENNFFSEIKT